MKVPKQRPNAWLLAISAVGLLLLAFLVWLGVGYLTRREPTPGWQDPVLKVRPDEVDPRLALLVLAGWPPQQVADLALSQKTWETAYAILVHSPEISDRERAGLWLLLGRGLAEAGQPDRALLCYQQAEVVGVLSPVLSDYLRADILSQAALGAAQIGQANLARHWAEETRVLLRGSADLQPVLRQQMADRVAEVYRLLGEKPPTLAVARAAPSGQVVEPLLPTLARPVDLPEAALQARQEREAAARQAVQWMAQGGAGGEWQAVLARALQQEDQVMASVLRQAAEGEVRLSVRAGWVRRRVEWLSIKYQVARRGFGLSLVPEWEERDAEIRSDLAKAYQDLFTLYQDEVVALPTVDLVRQGWVEVLAEEAKVGTLGLYPNYPEPEVAENLARRMDDWLQSRPEVAWRIATVQEGGGVEYVLVAR